MAFEIVPFDTNLFFSGGAGMFIQYHDVIKPVKLYVIIRMMLTNESYGLPIDILKSMRNISLIEWYMQRRYINPLKQLDYGNQLDEKELDVLLHQILISDPSLYRRACPLNVVKMLSNYRREHMNFPVYIYTEEEEPFVLEDMKTMLPGVPIHYVYGDLEKALSNCNQNFTYIFSNLELVKESMFHLHGTMSHILLTQDYRYNYQYKGRHKQFKYNLHQLSKEHPFIRSGTIIAANLNEIASALQNIYN